MIVNSQAFTPLRPQRFIGKDLPKFVLKNGVNLAEAKKGLEPSVLRYAETVANKAEITHMREAISNNTLAKAIEPTEKEYDFLEVLV